VREAIIKAKELGYTKMIIPNASKEIQLFWKEKNHWPWWIVNIIENMIMILKFELFKKSKKRDVQDF